MIEEIYVKNQEELDSIPKDYTGQIYIEFGTYCNPAIVRNCFPRKVVARENSSVTARGNSSVEAWGNSSVTARENSSVEAWENSSVEAWGNVQVVDMQQGARINLYGNSRIVYMPHDIFEFMDFYGIKHTKTKAIFYKAVHKIDGVYHSDYSYDFTYKINKIVKEDCDQNTDEDCSNGIHLSHLNWALQFGNNWKDLAILELETKIKDIVLPENSNGKVRTCEAKVLREIPLSDCGIYGKIIEKRNNNDKSNKTISK